ncbi:PilZ domain-containing protein [Thiorhodococcus mannitoliphagus]|uniref:PilZ domain-containing protein n=1 Tax=Thiorhodococcus mannitoliphagus TaxID=329406 RepID=A0A6P1DYH9_9GAMM|nr:PilZ domain-containing protein [Thiorhodococcus mannitoliphagus]NEX22071.1 PilZ domain-containing protein [Thiorhodococcus mannitoliphagus]
MLLDDERRDFKRMIAETQIEVTRLSSGEVVTAKLYNLSASGCAFISDLTIELDEELDILIRSPSERLEPLHRSGRVARVTQVEEGRLIGVHFTGGA